MKIANKMRGKRKNSSIEPELGLQIPPVRFRATPLEVGTHFQPLPHVGLIGVRKQLLHVVRLHAFRRLGALPKETINVDRQIIPREIRRLLRIGRRDFHQRTLLARGENHINLPDKVVISRANDQEIGRGRFVLVDRGAEHVVFHSLQTLARAEIPEER